MATVAAVLLEPNIEAVTQHLATLFAPCASDYPQGLVEIAYGADKPDSAALFPITKVGMTEAAAFAVEQNRRGHNVYVGVNPRKPGTNDNRRASDRDVEIAFWQFADLDDADVVALARERMPIKPSMIVLTGRTPSNRPHFYWQLEEPVNNLHSWAERQKGIADTLQGDRVINPSRIMRLGGTVNYPSPDKATNRGYAIELTTVRTEFSEERAPVTPEQIAQAFPQVAPQYPVEAPSHVEPGQTTLSAMAGGKTQQLITTALSGRNWHNSVRDLTARLAGKGRTNAEIMLMAPGLTLPGYTVADTEREMWTALQGARTKYGSTDDDDIDPVERSEDTYATLSLDELEALPPPTYLIDGLLPEHGLTVVYGDPGAGKSFLVLDICLRLAHGMDWYGAKAKRVGVLYIAGEGRHGLGKRVKGWRREHAMEGVDAPFKLLPVAVHMLDKDSVEKLKRTIAEVALQLNFEIGLVVIDTVSRAIAGQDENKQDAMSLFVDGCAAVQDFTDGAVIGVHHAGKDSSRGMRGSSVLLGGCDASLKVTKDEKIAKIEVEKQKDDEEIAPVYLKLKKVEWSAGLGKEQSTLVPEKTGKPTADEKTLSRRQADEIFDEVDAAWVNENPWSAFPQAKRKGRYLVDYISDTYDVTKRTAEDHITKWQTRGYMKTETQKTHGKATGLRVIKRLERDS